MSILYTLQRFFLNLPEDSKYCRNFAIFIIFLVVCIIFLLFWPLDKYGVQSNITWLEAVKHIYSKSILSWKLLSKLLKKFVFKNNWISWGWIDGVIEFWENSSSNLSQLKHLSDINTGQPCYSKKNFKNDKSINDFVWKIWQKYYKILILFK